MLGQPASSHTVCSPPERTSDLSSVYCGPVRALVLIHGGLRSIGVSLLRTSRRRSLRPSGAMVTSPGYAAGPVLHGLHPRGGNRRRRGPADLHRAPARATRPPFGAAQRTSTPVRANSSSDTENR